MDMNSVKMKAAFIITYTIKKTYNVLWNSISAPYSKYQEQRASECNVIDSQMCFVLKIKQTLKTALSQRHDSTDNCLLLWHQMTQKIKNH